MEVEPYVCARQRGPHHRGNEHQVVTVDPDDVAAALLVSGLKEKGPLDMGFIGYSRVEQSRVE